MKFRIEVGWRGVPLLNVSELSATVIFQMISLLAIKVTMHFFPLYKSGFDLYIWPCCCLSLHHPTAEQLLLGGGSSSNPSSPTPPSSLSAHWKVLSEEAGER